ncbi:MAG: iron-sulfur cluster assembly accessory protein [Oculatellaceae cyanobacterium Prado106]|jgi:iron-sulfur cluster assembly accessory protein|nr:iron-sulfur cluster assembly accessory protein [Oculatellaceae cyanobacterium Prado106]
MIRLSQTAIAEIHRMQAKQPTAQFRLGVQPGGCAEFYYTLDLVDAIAPNEQILDCSGMQVIVPIQSIPYLDGLTLDYSEDLMGGGFRFDNPHAVSSCGCGNSFAIATS